MLSQLVFAARIKAFNTWQAAEANLRKVRLAHDKAKRAGKTHSELLGLSLSEIAEVSLSDPPPHDKLEIDIVPALG